MDDTPAAVLERDSRHSVLCQLHQYRIGGGLSQTVVIFNAFYTTASVATPDSHYLRGDRRTIRPSCFTNHLSSLSALHSG